MAAGGIVFAAIALSLQSSLSDLIKGIFVNIERPFSINDWITVDDKTGYVENITWRSTRIRTFQMILDKLFRLFFGKIKVFEIFLLLPWTFCIKSRKDNKTPTGFL